MIIIAMRFGTSPDKPESTTLLTLLPVFLSQPRAGFFLPVALFSKAHHSDQIFFINFEQRREVFQLSIEPAQVQTALKH